VQWEALLPSEYRSIEPYPSPSKVAVRKVWYFLEVVLRMMEEVLHTLMSPLRSPNYIRHIRLGTVVVDSLVEGHMRWLGVRKGS